MKNRLVYLVAIVFGLTAFFPSAALADGIIVPDPPHDPAPGPYPVSQLGIRYHHVTVTIRDQVAVTHVDQVFYNPNDWTVEGTYFFPVPVGATVDKFVLWIDGKAVKGEILDANQARDAYEQIVRDLKDPALLEYAGRGAVKARIFPIPAGGERRIELEYSEVLPLENGLVRYRYPLDTEKFSSRPIDNVSIRVSVSGTSPVRAVYSPSHRIDINRVDDHHVVAGIEQNAVLPDKDFVLMYSVGEGDGLHLLTYRDSDDLTADGYFMALIAPRLKSETVSVSKDVILVLDRSGSMEGAKFRQAQDALVYILNHLKEDDRFDVIAFSTGMETFSAEMQPAVRARDAVQWVERLGASGSTDINRALLEAAALADAERPVYVIFLTDGLPTQGVTDSDGILMNFADSAKNNVRLFAFGVGYDVDTYLLDTLAKEHHGASTYVLPEERLDEVISGFYAKISTPVLTDLKLDFGDITVYDVFPKPLPDLFAGSQIVVVGRYKGSGKTKITLSGYVNGERQTVVFDTGAFGTTSAGDLDAIPKLWATRKIGYLLNQVRLQGAEKELVDQIVRLSIRYGIITPYTSYLVTEKQPLGEAASEKIAGEELKLLQNAHEAPAYGRDAVEKAANQGALEEADIAVASPDVTGNIIRNIGSGTFVYANGIWQDTRYDPDKDAVQKVAFLSDDYFRLSRISPQLAAALALGNHVIVIWQGKAFEVVSSGEDIPAVELPDADTPVETVTESIRTDNMPDMPPLSDVETPENGQEKNPAFPGCVGGLAPLIVLPLLLVMIKLYL